MTQKSHPIVEKKDATGSLDSDGRPMKVGLKSFERGASPYEEGEINSPAQNPPKVALTFDDLNKHSGDAGSTGNNS
ncbi:hypothetical protein JCGZ_12666 [Jatropha curcas]|uniref:Uncharacterized protein n=1 Tax=Jatropha curcas TaxID=180498 RepID=A0A067KH56_JATCU|nr:hypothetical protein JCGZ_12666 [Jatropha curcas]